MTTPADSGPTDVEGRTLPPYEGRRESADVAGAEKLRRDDANVGGATGPVESDERKAPEPAETRGEDVGDRASEDRDYGYDELGAGD
jgi:hypothetical protein